MAGGVKPTPAIERLLRRCVEDENGCWVFQGAKTPGGYGVVGTEVRRVNAVTHRVTFEHFIAAVPVGLDLDHLCRNRACCNPWHLEPVTRKVNANRGLRAKGYLDPQCRNGHGYAAENTSIRPDGTRRCNECRRARSYEKKAAA